MAESAAGVPGFERRAVLRHDGLLARLANGRMRGALAPPFIGGSANEAACGTPVPIGTRLGDFEVTGIVHRDSFGIVYAGEDRSSHRRIAITEYFPVRLAERMTLLKEGQIVPRPMAERATRPNPLSYCGNSTDRALPHLTRFAYANEHSRAGFHCHDKGAVALRVRGRSARA